MTSNTPENKAGFKRFGGQPRSNHHCDSLHKKPVRFVLALKKEQCVMESVNISDCKYANMFNTHVTL